MNNDCLNHLMILHVYQDIIGKVNIREKVIEFISRKDSERNDLAYKLCNVMIDTVLVRK